MSRFIKISSTGEQLPEDAKHHVAVLDTKTNLMWSANDLFENRVTQLQAAEKAPLSGLAGFSDWRLPEVEELFALADRSKRSPAIDENFFQCRSDWYHTNTAWAGSPSDSAWYVSFYGGDSLCGDRDDSTGFVRAVRSVSPSQ